MEYISNDNNERLSWVVLKMWCFIISICVWRKIEATAWVIMDYIRVIIWAHQLYIAMQCSIWQKLNLNLFQMSTCILLKCMRGVVSYIYKGYSKAKKKYVKSDDPKQESKHIYLDANNLYGYAISKFLPSSELKQIDPKDFYWNKYSSNSSKGCFLEVDLEYPKEFCKLGRNDYSLAPDKIENKKKNCCIVIN